MLRIARTTAALLLASLIAAPALAQPEPVREQLDMTLEHAGYAATAANELGYKLHLQHALNCLSRPGQPAYNARVGNPCAGLGQGLLMDLPPEYGPQRQAVQALIQQGQQALQLTEPAAMQAAADEFYQQLRRLEDSFNAS